MRVAGRGARAWITPIALAVTGALLAQKGWAENYFNPAFLSDDPSAVADLSHFDNSEQMPGTYRVDIYLNTTRFATRDVRFQRAKTAPPGRAQDNSGLDACLSPEMLAAMGVDLKILTASKPQNCVDIATLIPAATSHFDFDNQRLDISIPQAALKNDARGYIPPEQWDEGINALLLNYNFTGSNSRDRSEGGSADNSYFLGLNSGLNLGPWRLRDYSTWNKNGGDDNSSGRWQHINTYVKRDIIPLKGELIAGDNYTPSDVFDSLPFRGVQIASDDNMLPDSMKGFAPTIHGIAKSNAQVTIRQNRYVIYQSYVPPGAFSINDLYPTSSSGDLTVEVKESDGSVSSYTVPYSAVPVLQREGRVKYALTVAKYRGDSGDKDDVSFGQGTLLWGLSHGITLYGGAQASAHYRAAALGGGVNLGDLGAVSVDVTQAHSQLADDSEHQGQSVRFLYAKSLSMTGTNVQLMGYRYSTSGFYTLDETTWKHMSGYIGQDDDDDEKSDWSNYYSLYYTKRGKVQANISQPLGKLGSIFITASRQSYWHTDETQTLMQVGYSDVLAGVNWSLTYNDSQSPGASQHDRLLALNLSLPIGQWLHPGGDVTQPHHNVFATYSVSSDNHHNVTQNSGISGTLLKDDNLSYSIQQGYQNHGAGSSGTMNVEYDGAYGNLSAGYNDNQNGDYQQVNYGLSGGIVAHSHGITFSQPLGDTNVLIAAPGADHVKVDEQQGIYTDGRGYAVVPYATTYRENRLALDVNSMADDVDIDDAVTHVVPTDGALVRAKFKARVGERALLTLIHGGKAVPFGATAVRDDGGDETIVGDNGEVYLAGLTPSGVLHVQWGQGQAQRCLAHYQLPATHVLLARQNVECQ